MQGWQSQGCLSRPLSALAVDDVGLPCNHFARRERPLMPDRLYVPRQLSFLLPGGANAPLVVSRTCGCFHGDQNRVSWYLREVESKQRTWPANVGNGSAEAGCLACKRREWKRRGKLACKRREWTTVAICMPPLVGVSIFLGKKYFYFASMIFSF